MGSLVRHLRTTTGPAIRFERKPPMLAYHWRFLLTSPWLTAWESQNLKKKKKKDTSQNTDIFRQFLSLSTAKSLGFFEHVQEMEERNVCIGREGTKSFPGRSVGLHL